RNGGSAMMASIAARASPRSRIPRVSGAIPSRAEATLESVNAVCSTTSATLVRAIVSRNWRTSSSLGWGGCSATGLLHLDQRRRARRAHLAGERLLERRPALDRAEQALGAVALVEHPLDRPQVRLEAQGLDLRRGGGQQPADALRGGHGAHRAPEVDQLARQ